MVALARRLNPGIEFHHADVEELPFDDGAFEAVVGHFVVPHLGRPERSVAECGRVLAPGGRLVLSMWDTPDRNRLVGVLAEALEQVKASPPADIPPGPPFFRFSSDEEFSSLFASTGFEEVEVRRFSFTHRLSGDRLSGADELWSGLVGGTVRMAALVAGQSEQMRRRIRAAFDRIVSEYAVAEGLEIPVSVKVASGRRFR